MNAKIPWVIAGVLAVISATLSLSEIRSVAPQVVTKEVVREVVKEVPKEVIREVVTEVPKEVIKEVAAPIPEQYEWAKNFLNKYAAALSSSLESQDNLLRGLESVRVAVFITDKIENKITKSEVKDSIELSLRKNGIPVRSDSAAIISFLVDGLWDEKKIVFSYSARFSVRMNHPVWINKEFVLHSVEIWEEGFTGYAGSDVISNGIEKAYAKLVTSFSNKYLAANGK
jgi:hypothetical protein